MTIRTVRHRIDRARTVKHRCQPARTVTAILDDVEFGLGRLTLAEPIKLSLRIFHQIIDEHRAGKKARI